MLQPYGRIYEGLSMVNSPTSESTRRSAIPPLCSCCCIAAFHRGRSPIRPTLHCREGPTSSISSLNERQHRVEPMEMHVRRKRMTRRSRLHQRRLLPSLWRCPPTKRISEKGLPETQNALVARILADRLSRAFAVVYTRLTSIPLAFPSTVDDDVAHAAWHAAVGY